MSIWQAFGFWVVVAIAATILLPLLAISGWYIYVGLTPAGRAWKTWLDRELGRLKRQEGKGPLPCSHHVNKVR